MEKNEEETKRNGLTTRVTKNKELEGKRNEKEKAKKQKNLKKQRRKKRKKV